VTTDTYYNTAWQVLETRRSDYTNDPYEQYVWDVRYIDAPVLRDRDSNDNGTLDETVYYTTDANMNVTALVDTSGNVVERYAYDPYGQVLVLNGANGTDPDVDGSTVFEWDIDADGASDVANEILFAGYRFDAETGLYHVRHRMYHATLGRWLQRDPEGYADGNSLLEYTSSEPVSRHDPYGRSWLDSLRNTLSGIFAKPKPPPSPKVREVGVPVCDINDFLVRDSQVRIESAEAWPAQPSSFRDVRLVDYPRIDECDSASDVGSSGLISIRYDALVPVPYPGFGRPGMDRDTYVIPSGAKWLAKCVCCYTRPAARPYNAVFRVFGYRPVSLLDHLEGDARRESSFEVSPPAPAISDRG